MRDQSSQFVPSYGLHVVGEKKICFQTIIFEGVNFIVNSSQGSDSKYNMVYICSKHAQDQYRGFSFESMASVLLISDYYHLIIGQMIKFYYRWQYVGFS